MRADGFGRGAVEVREDGDPPRPHAFESGPDRAAGIAQGEAAAVRSRAFGLVRECLTAFGTPADRSADVHDDCVESTDGEGCPTAPASLSRSSAVDVPDRYRAPTGPSTSKRDSVGAVVSLPSQVRAGRRRGGGEAVDARPVPRPKRVRCTPLAHPFTS
ncbi:hypothetical protein ABIA38_003455 [Embleya sp. AB8]